MASIYRLKKPFFVTFTSASTSAGREFGGRLPEALTREEAIIYVEIEPQRLEPGEVDERKGYQNVDDLLSRLDLMDFGPDEIAEVRSKLERTDLDFALREAFLGAEFRARDYFRASAQRTADAMLPIETLGYEERREASYQQVRDYLRDFPEEAEADRKDAEYLREYPEEVQRRADKADQEMRESGLFVLPGEAAQ